MNKQSKILNPEIESRFQSCPRIGDTQTNLSLKYLIALNDFEERCYLPFRSYSQPFGQVLKRFILNTQSPPNTRYSIQYTKTNEIISEAKRLETYKQQIEDSEYIYFKIYETQSHLQDMKINELEKLKHKSGINNPDFLNIKNQINLFIIKPNSQEIQIKISKYSLVKLLKLEICKKQNLNYEEIRLIFAGKPLNNDEQILDDIGIQNQSMLLLTLKANKGCFSGNSLIMMINNSLKYAKDVKVEDKILSYNQKSKQFQQDEIISIHKTYLRNYLQIYINDNTMIQCTANHKFLTSKRQWKCFEYNDRQCRLQIGDEILINNISTGISIGIIKNIIYKQSNKLQQFYHISTKTNHTFLINNLITHNMQIKILKTYDKTQFKINIIQSDTIQIIKNKIEQQLKINKHQIILVLNKKQLKNTQSISDYLLDIKNCNYLQMMIHQKYTIVINRLLNKRQYHYKFDKLLTIKDLKKIIEKQLNIDYQHQILILNNTQMLNSKKIIQFQLDKNFNRINLIQVDNLLMSQSKYKFQQSKILHVMISTNQYLRLNYYSIKQMKIQQFIISFVSNSKNSHTLLFNQLILKPSQYLKQIQDNPIFNNPEINCYVICCFDKMNFKNMIDFQIQYNPQILSFDPQDIQKCSAKQAAIKSTMKDMHYLYNVKNKFNEQLQSFIRPLQHYSILKSKDILQKYLKKISILTQLQIKNHNAYNFCSSLVRSLQLITPYLGQTHRIIKNIRFKDIYTKRGQTFYIQSFLSTHSDIHSLNKSQNNYTILHIRSITGKQIGIYTSSLDQVVFLPFTYFYIQKISSNSQFDQLWLTQIPSPQTFQKDILMWVDDQPQSVENRQISNLIDFSRYELVQLVSTQIAQYWMRQFNWILKWKNRNIKIMSDMKRKQGELNTIINQAGINLIQILHKNLGYTAPIFVFCKDVHAARKSLANRKIEAGRIQKLTSDQFELITYLSGP